MTLSELSIRRPVFAWMLMAGLILFGGVAFSRMGISQLPDVDFPVVSVNIRLEGASPEIIETSIVDFVEDAVMSIQGVRSVTSESENSEGTVTIEFDLDRNIDLAAQDVEAKVASILQKLPKDIGQPTIRKTNPEDQPIMQLTLESDRYPLKTLMSYTSDRVKDRFSSVAGVGDIVLGGYLDPNLRVWVSSKKLDRYNMTVGDVINTIQNEHLELPAGQLETGRRVLNVRTMGEAETVPEFENLLINQRGGQPNYRPIRLKEVARVEEGLADTLRLSRAMGVPGVSLGILKQRGSNAVAVSRAVRTRVAEIQSQLPEGMKLGINFDSTRYIEQAVHELDLTLVLSALLTAAVCLLFLGSWSSTLNVVLAIPTSVVGAFVVLYFCGFTLNTFTLLGLSLSIGIVVDDAIMVLENIIRHLEKGKSRYQAALHGSQEITFAAVAATISIVAIFLPVAFMSGVIGRFFFQFGVTITVAVLLSLLEALTLTPMRCAQFVDTEKRHTIIGRSVERSLDVLASLYARSLSWSLDHRTIVIGLALVAFLGSASTGRLLKKEFLPPEDQSRFIVRLKTPIGSNLSYTDSKFKPVEAFLAARPEVDRYLVQVGGGSPGDSNHGQVTITMKQRGQRGIDPAAGHELSQLEFMAVCRKKFNAIGDVKATVQDLSSRTFTASRGFPVEFTIEGPEWDQLAGYARAVQAEMEKTGFMTDIDSNYDAGQPELRVLPDREKASLHGVSIASVAEMVNAMIGGERVASYSKGGHRYDVRVKLDEPAGSPTETLNRLSVRNNRGELIPLSELVTAKEQSSMVTIWRRDRERAISVYANIAAGASQQQALDAVRSIGRRLLPPGYHVTMSGSSQTMLDSFRSLTVVLVLGILVAYMVLGSQFNSFIDPLSVLMALPFSVSGAFVALLLAHQSVNIYSVIGLILLMGIVKKNSILLVDFTNQVRANGTKDPRAALLAACPVRLRPILMTSVATIAGAIPAALSVGPGSESRVPMAIAIIGGVLFSTVLTLYVVPCFYSAMARFDRRARHEELLSKL